ncbi:hypothetical protein C9439_01120 [archaeon SCG-AAA382B04]|nr:hypothetical protein C9439_01120 [archaeon SCG-AAA382B04]
MMDERTISKYSFKDTGIVLTDESLIVRSNGSERRVPISKINSFYVYPKRKLLGKMFLVFANISDEEDFEVLSIDEKNSAVSLKNDLNRALEDL